MSDSAVIVLLDPKDGQEKRIPFTLGMPDWEDGIEYMWRDGSYSCDCNKRLFIEREAGREPGDDETPCGEKIALVRIEYPEAAK